MSITVECQRRGCGASADIGMTDGDWSGKPRVLGDPFAGLGYGDELLVALPEGWRVDTIVGGDTVIHCPDHADA